jgi:glucokinase
MWVKHGCVEVFATATAIVRMARELIDSGQAPHLARVAESEPEFSAKIVYNQAIQGDEPSRAIFRRMGASLGIGMGNMVNALNLPMYVIGGGVASAWDAFAPSMFAEMLKRCMVYAATAPGQLDRSGAQLLPATKVEGAASQVRPQRYGKTTIVTRALLGSDAGLYGAARLPMMSSDSSEHAQLAARRRA